MSSFLEILQCILCCEEGGERDRSDYEDLSRSSSSLSHFIDRISRHSFSYGSYAPVPSTAPESIGRPWTTAPEVVSSPSQSVRPENSVNSTVGGLIYERDCGNQSSVRSASTVSGKESTKQSGTASKSPIPSLPSPSLPKWNSADHVGVTPRLDPPRTMRVSISVSDPPKKLTGALSGLDQLKKSSGAPASLISDGLKKLPGSPSGLDQLKKSSGAPASLISDGLKKLPGPPSGLDPPNKSQGSPVGSDPTNSLGTAWRKKIVVPTYTIPENFEDLIKKDMVPEILRKSLSPSTYKDYFAALLYAEDYYHEKWSGFLLNGVTLKLHEELASQKSRKSSKTVLHMEQNDKIDRVQKEKRVFVAFEIDSIPERRPYLLSRDFVFVKPSGKDTKAFKGILSRVVKSTLVLVEFGRDFHSQYSLAQKYDVSFSFNRICLKRSHQAIEAATDTLFRDYLFPNPVPRSKHFIHTSLTPCRDFDHEEISTIHQILALKGPPPYLVVGGLFSHRTGPVICEAIIQIYRSFEDSRILVATPKNHTCDLLMRRLNTEIPDVEMFRANAAFREFEDVPDDILSSSLYNGECFTCPSLHDLRNFKVITSTFVSSFRLHNEGINAGHFTHIFMVDASCAMEPETMITLANMADERTAVVVTGSYEHCPDRVRSDIARRNGLKRSYFERLLESEPYSSRNPTFVSHLTKHG